MQAHERAFSFIKGDCFYEVPFFQRGYVWSSENWEELIENLLDVSKSAFLGSIILKQKRTPSGEPTRFMIIDGQQRLTTLSILLRAVYDSLMKTPNDYSQEVRSQLESALNAQLFVIRNSFTGRKEVKIRHSHVDKKSYEKVIEGAYSADEFVADENARREDIRSREPEAPQDKILQCYRYFMQYLSEKCEVDAVQRLWENLTKEKIKFLVNIDLGEEENEQAIFDTVNTAGVRLTCSDTIKNALYQKYIDVLKDDPTIQDAEAAAIAFYQETWGQAFLSSAEDIAYWTAKHQSGRLFRENLEILLHCVAVIDGFFDPSEMKMSDLSVCYKKHIEGMGKEVLKEFIEKIKEMSGLYKEKIVAFENCTQFKYDDYFLRLIHICDILEVSTFYPYFLNLLYKNQKEESPDDSELEQKCADIERYIVLHAVCGATTKNYNKECVQLLKGVSVQMLMANCSGEINETSFLAGLTSVRSNKLATLLLFWIELYKREQSHADIKELKYTYTLEHIMPQKWQKYWPIAQVPVYGTDGAKVQDEQEAVKTRGKAIYSIGNMTLLNAKLNTSLRNFSFERKMNGEGRKRGIKDLADCLIARTLIDKKEWDEREIAKREEGFIADIKQIWNIKF